MSFTYNGIDVQSIIYNGQALEEVWMNGVQVFDAYDPTTIPAGTLSFNKYTTLPDSY